MLKVSPVMLAACLASSVSNLALLSTGASAQTLQDEGNAAGAACEGMSVNNSGVVVGFCFNGAVEVGFVAATAGQETALAPIAAGTDCAASEISNSGVIVGTCANSSGGRQGVFWNASSPGAAPTVLAPLLLGVSTFPTAMNQQGLIVGVSKDASGTMTPVIWSSTGVPTELPVGLLGLSTTNCIATDVADGTTTTPQVVGICPSSSGTSTPVSWTFAGLAYGATTLSLPSGGLACNAARVNATGQIGGFCIVTTAGEINAVRWNSATSAPTELTSLNRTHTSDMNASGQVAGGDFQGTPPENVFFWDPTSGVTKTMPPPSDGIAAAELGGIADDGTIVGSFEVQTDRQTGEQGGPTHGFVWTSSGNVDVGTLGGANSALKSVSESGCYAAGWSEVTSEGRHAVIVTSIPCGG
jgi:uncharacterized membrane protein